jgi:transposase
MFGDTHEGSINFARSKLLGIKIFLLVDCCDMRKGFNGLYGLVNSSFGEDPRSGALYVFCNRRHTRIKDQGTLF